MSASDSEAKRSPGLIFLILFCSWILFHVGQVVYRLFFHPLAKFPGPKLAAASFLVEGYYDVIKRGKYCHKIAEYHQKYGPIVRINPQELHIFDPSYFDNIYCGKGRWEKPPFMVRSIDLGFSSFGTLDHDLHRLRRGSLNRFFSKQKVVALQHVIQDLANKLCDKLERHCNNGIPIDFESAFGDFTLVRNRLQ
jgi:hypothetical protein